MIRLIGLGGVPGTGKTTVARRLMAAAEPLVYMKSGPLTYHFNRELGLAFLGTYTNGVFDGTDRLSMSVQPYVVQWLKIHSAVSAPIIRRVFFEGDRLFNGTFIEAAHKACDALFLVLTAAPALAAERRLNRGGAAMSTFVKGRETKYAALVERGRARAYPHETPAATRALAVFVAGEWGLSLRDGKKLC